MEPRIYINPTSDEIREAVSLSGNMLKSICDASGNLYLWDGEAVAVQAQHPLRQASE